MLTHGPRQADPQVTHSVKPKRMTSEVAVEPSRWQSVIVSVTASLYSGTTLGTGLLTLLYSSVVPGLSWSDDCGMQFTFVLPLAVGLLLISVPAVISADRLGLRGFLKWYAPIVGLLSLGASTMVEVDLGAHLLVGLVVWSALLIYGIVAVARIIGHRWRSA